MRRMLLLIACLAATAPALGQTSDVEQFVAAGEAALAANDAAFFDRFLAEEWTVIGPDGTTVTKTEILKSMKDGTFKLESLEPLERKVRASGDTAVVTGRRRMKYAGNPMKFTNAYTDVLIKRDGKWLYIASHVTPVRTESVAPSGEGAVNADWAQVRGKWEREAKDKEGKTFRATKEIRGNQETITYYDNEGKVVYTHTVEVKLERVGNVRLFTYSNGKVLAGPNKDQEVSPKPFSYVYTTDGQMFAEVMGFLAGQEESLAKAAPQLTIWKRAKE